MACTTKLWAAMRNTVINWPPLILFVVCLITFSGVALILGAYVYNTEGIPDRDSLSWNMFLDDMERHGFCPHPPAVTNSTGDPARAHVVSVLLPASGWADLLSANGSLLQLEDPAAVGLNVSLEPVSAAGSQLLCVRLWGPRSAMPRAARPPPPDCDTAAATAAARAGTGSVELIQDGLGRCAGGGTRYRLEYTPVAAWDLTLSMVDRERVYAHLSCTSAFLVVMAVCMLLCTLVRNRSRFTLAAGDKVPLSDG